MPDLPEYGIQPAVNGWYSGVDQRRPLTGQNVFSGSRFRETLQNAFSEEGSNVLVLEGTRAVHPLTEVYDDPTRRNLRLDDDIFHTLPWVGAYYAASYSENGRFDSYCVLSELDDDGLPVAYGCAHCAYKRAIEITPMPALVPGRDYYDVSVVTAPTILMLPRRSSTFALYFFPPLGELRNAAFTVRTTKLGRDYELGRSCGNCGLLGHNARTCTKGKQAYMKVGIEIEGKWSNLNAVKDRALSTMGSRGTSDGSVRNGSESEIKAWEFQTKPGSLRDALKQLIDFYPDETDSSCGMHVHVSFSAHDTGLLSTEEFFAYYKERWLRWATRHNLPKQGEFRRRFEGKNTYCMPNASIPTDITSTDKYSHLNFSAWHKQKTLECRMLPMFVNAWLGVDAICELMSIYQDYLDACELHLAMPANLVGPEDAVELISLCSETREVDIDLELMAALQMSTLEHELEVATYEDAAPGMRRMGLSQDIINQINALAPGLLGDYLADGAELEAA